MIALTSGLLFLLGAVWGSFGAAALYRIPRRQSLGGRSHCPTCGQQIEARDNIPILSWVLLGGRSRCCREPISPSYLLIETAGGLIGAGAAICGLAIPFVIAGAIFSAALAAVAAIRSRH